MIKAPIFYPLTYPQKAIWYTEKFYPGTGVANIVSTMRLRKGLDFNALEQAINYVIKYNDGLRLRILEDVLGLRQYVAPYQNHRLKFIDFSSQGGWKTFLQWLNEDGNIPFKSIDSDLFEFVLYKIGEGDGGFYVKTHHAIADAWSMILIGNQINDFYFKIKAGAEPDDPNFPSYLDYIELERQYEQSEEFRVNREFWNNKFATVPEPTSLRPANIAFGSCESKRKSFALSWDLTTRINQYAEELGVSVFVLFLSALAIYLHRILDREDIIIGTPLLNRKTIKEKTTLGMFIETIPVRLFVNEEFDFEAFALQVAEEWRGFRSHRYPYNLLLEDIRSQHKTTSNLYDIMLSYQSARFNSIFSFESNNYSSGSDPNALLFHVSDRENAGQLKVEIDYQTALFNEEDTEHIFNHLVCLLNDALSTPSKKIYELNLITAGERAWLLDKVNNTRADYPHDKTIPQLFEEQVIRTPQKTALVFEGDRLSYEDLNRQANRYARLLRERGVAPGTIVGLMADRSLEMIVGIMAILKAGGAYLPLDPTHPTERIQYTLTDSGAKLVLTQPHLTANIKELDYIVLGETSGLPNQDSDLDNVNAPTDLAYVLYTSGSTGKPKGVMVEHHSVVNFFTAMEREVELSGKTMLSVTTICFDIFVFESLLPLVKGLTVVIANEEQQLLPWKLKDLIEAQQVNIIQTTPSRMQMLTSDEAFNSGLTTVTDIILGGEPLPQHLAERLKKHTQARIFNGYGPTEATVYSTFKDVTEDAMITIGHPVANFQAYILDKRLHLVPYGFTGELYIGGAGVGRGYLNRPDLTEERFIPNPFRSGERMYKTGDLAEWDRDGNIHFAGRKDHQVKIRGYRIELGEIEQILREYGEISEAVVAAKKDETDIQYLCGYLIADPDLDISNLRKYLADHLPEYMIPSVFVTLDEMPVNPSGKVCRRTLMNMPDQPVTSSVRYSKPRNEVDEILAREWADKLKSNPVGIDDNFFELGGDSLKIVRMLVALLPFNWDLTARDFYRYQTIRALSDKISGVGDEVKWDSNMKDIAVVPFKHDPRNLPVSPKKTKLGNVLLTGATGYLGSHLLKDLLTLTDAEVYCLIRGNSQTEAQHRLANVLDFYFPGAIIQAILKRVHVYPGDITLPGWGLNNVQFNELSQTINTVIHSAAMVKHYGGYDQFEKVNVNGTKSVAEFCRQGNKRLHYVSTTSVSGYYLVDQNPGQTVFTENDLYIGQHYYENVYVRSKFEAENLILQHMAKGLNAAIHRIGVLAGRYSDGQFQANINDNALYNRLRSIIQLGFVQEDYQTLDIELSPVDYCSRAIILLSEIEESNCHIFHVFNHKTIHLNDLTKAAHQCGYPIKNLNRGDYEDKIKEIQTDPYRRDLLTGIINDFSINRSIGLQNFAVIDSGITVDYLHQLGFEWPEINFEYLEKLIHYMESIGFIVKSETLGF
ncbi:MAG: amino acid adenylation domain-containing protein [Syntrophomonadaceae bacterium]|nr:amino acid adenylation domain-containing protein [Syntrophomonadaceae bacterium]